MQGREPCLERRRAGFIIEVGEQRQLFLPDFNDPVFMALHIPFVVIVLDARNRTITGVCKTGVNSRRGKEIGDMAKQNRLCAICAVLKNIDAEFCMMINFRKET